MKKESAEAFLHSFSPCPLRIVWHENRTAYFYSKKEKGSLCLKLHRLFWSAPTPVLKALIDYALHQKSEGRFLIKQMAHFYFSRSKMAPAPLESSGKAYDLKGVLEQVRSLFPLELHREIPEEIGWSRRGSAVFRSITLGSYDGCRRQIRIHPFLDDPEVPLYFIQFIVYHEVLHAFFPPKMERSGRCSIHSIEFRRKEKEFPQFRKAKEWEKRCIEFFQKRGANGRS